MSKTMNFNLGFFLIALILFVVTISPVKAEIKIGESSPQLVVSTLNGKEFDLARLKGKVVLIHFWATWCSACRKEMPILNHFYQIYYQKNLEMIALSIDRSHERKDVVKMVSDFAFPLAMSSDAKKNGFGSPNALPVTYLIDQAGKVNKIFKPGGEELSEKNLTDAYLMLLH